MSPTVLFDLNEHEPVTNRSWDPDEARSFVARTIEQIDATFEPARGWVPHPEDDGPNRQPFDGVYNGTAGTMWALTHLARSTGTTLTNDYAAEIARCEQTYRAGKDVVPSYFIGTVGITLARYAITGERAALDRIAADIRSNLGNPTREALWGSPGTIIAALLLREQTGDARYDDLIRDVQDELWSTWVVDGGAPFLWRQDLYGSRSHYVGAAHGAAGNLLPFLRALDILRDDRRGALRERVASMLETYAIRMDNRANWWAAANPLRGRAVQWCHGAPGIIISLSSYPPGDERVDDFLLQGAECTWRAGPLRKGPTLCHGTAGNGFALLRMVQRTGNDIWRERAEKFATHAMAQVATWRETFGMPSPSLWTGDLGVALFVDAVLRNDPRVLSIDTM